jgi:cysteine-rich repeat protein
MRAMRAHSRFVFPAAFLALSLSACGSSEPAASSPICGNGVVEAGEACDDGNASSTDGCLATCVVASCGDGFVRAGVEACDDGNALAGDGCSPACAVETGFACAGEPSVCQAGCGNGARADPEECDDGDNRNLDGCDAACRFEQVLRARQLTFGWTATAACPDNAFGGAVRNGTARDQVQTALTQAVESGDLTLLLWLRGLDAPDGLAGIADASVEAAVLGGGVHPDYAAAFTNASQLDGWFMARAPWVGADRLPPSFLPGSFAGGVLAAGPGRVGMPISLGGGAGGFALIEAHLRFTATGLSAPTASPGGSPPGHTLSEHLLATLQSFQAAGAGHLCGGIQARSLAAVHLPAQFLTFCSAYTAANTFLDLLVGGCVISGIITVVAPTQPDMVDPAAPVLGAGGPYRFTTGSGRAVTGCSDATGAAVDLQACLDAAAYSSIFGFAADRVIVKPACGDGVVDPGDQCDDGNTLASDGCSATCTVEAGWACTGSPSVCTLL